MSSQQPLMKDTSPGKTSIHSLPTELKTEIQKLLPLRDFVAASKAFHCEDCKDVEWATEWKHLLQRKEIRDGIAHNRGVRGDVGLALGVDLDAGTSAKELVVSAESTLGAVNGGSLVGKTYSWIKAKGFGKNGTTRPAWARSMREDGEKKVRQNVDRVLDAAIKSGPQMDALKEHVFLKYYEFDARLPTCQHCLDYADRSASANEHGLWLCKEHLAQHCQQGRVSLDALEELGIRLEEKEFRCEGSHSWCKLLTVTIQKGNVRTRFPTISHTDANTIANTAFDKDWHDRFLRHRSYSQQEELLQRCAREPLHKLRKKGEEYVSCMRAVKALDNFFAGREDVLGPVIGGYSPRQLGPLLKEYAGNDFAQPDGRPSRRPIYGLLKRRMDVLGRPHYSAMISGASQGVSDDRLAESFVLAFVRKLLQRIGRRTHLDLRSLRIVVPSYCEYGPVLSGAAALNMYTLSSPDADELCNMIHGSTVQDLEAKIRAGHDLSSLDRFLGHYLCRFSLIVRLKLSVTELTVELMADVRAILAGRAEERRTPFPGFVQWVPEGGFKEEDVIGNVSMALIASLDQHLKDEEPDVLIDIAVLDKVPDRVPGERDSVAEYWESDENAVPLEDLRQWMRDKHVWLFGDITQIYKLSIKDRAGNFRLRGTPGQWKAIFTLLQDNTVWVRNEEVRQFIGDRSFELTGSRELTPYTCGRFVWFSKADVKVMQEQTRVARLAERARTHNSDPTFRRVPRQGAKGTNMRALHPAGSAHAGGHGMKQAGQGVSASFESPPASTATAIGDDLSNANFSDVLPGPFDAIDQPEEPETIRDSRNMGCFTLSTTVPGSLAAAQLSLSTLQLDSPTWPGISSSSGAQDMLWPRTGYTQPASPAMTFPFPDQSSQTIAAGQVQVSRPRPFTDLLRRLMQFPHSSSSTTPDQVTRSTMFTAPQAQDMLRFQQRLLSQQTAGRIPPGLHLNADATVAAASSTTIPAAETTPALQQSESLPTSNMTSMQHAQHPASQFDAQPDSGFRNTPTSAGKSELESSDSTDDGSMSI